MKKSPICISIIITLFLCFAYCDDSWHLETVYTEGEAGFNASLKLDSNNYPHIAHYENGNKKLLYSVRDGDNWSTCFVEPEASSGSHCSLALDATDHPHIAYYDSTDYDLKYAYFNGSQWKIQVVDAEGAVGSGTSIALDSNRLPHIAYWDLTNFDLKYASYDGINWILETVDSNGQVGMDASLALDSRDLPHISYKGGGLKYAHYDGITWNSELIDTLGDCGYSTSIALDKYDRSHIAHSDWYRQPRYVYYEDSSWKIINISDGEFNGMFLSMALDAEDKPHVSVYTNPSDDNLIYGYLDGSNWIFETIDPEYGSGFFSSIAMDNMDRPAIAYQTYWAYELRFAWFDDGYLGIKLLSFTSNSTNTGVTLKWSTESSTSSEVVGFNLYRATDLGGDRSAEVRLNSILISPQPECTFIDEEALLDLKYTYRLEAILDTGKAVSLGTLYTQRQMKRVFAIGNIYPQPAKSHVSFMLQTNDSQTPIRASIYDLTGRLINTTVLQCNSYESQINQVDTSHLSAGIYILSVVQGNDHSNRRIIIRH